MKNNKEDIVTLCTLVISTLLFLGLTAIGASYGWNTAEEWGLDLYFAIEGALAYSVVPLVLSVGSTALLAKKIIDIKERSSSDIKANLKKQLKNVNLSKLAGKTVKLNSYKIIIKKIEQNAKVKKR